MEEESEEEEEEDEEKEDEDEEDSLLLGEVIPSLEEELIGSIAEEEDSLVSKVEEKDAAGAAQDNRPIRERASRHFFMR